MPTKHGHSRRGRKTLTYQTWCGMLNRCNDINHPRYGGRGIKVCDRWKDYNNFLEDMGEKPDGYSLERIDNNGNYCPQNCKWATRVEQARNTSRNKFYEYKGKTYTITELSRMFNIQHMTIFRRLEKGYTVEQAVETPSYKRILNTNKKSGDK